jgi:hypothetical protein
MVDYRGTGSHYKQCLKKQKKKKKKKKKKNKSIVEI